VAEIVFDDYEPESWQPWLQHHSLSAAGLSSLQAFRLFGRDICLSSSCMARVPACKYNGTCTLCFAFCGHHLTLQLARQYPRGMVTLPPPRRCTASTDFLCTWVLYFTLWFDIQCFGNTETDINHSVIQQNHKGTTRYPGRVSASAPNRRSSSNAVRRHTDATAQSVPSVCDGNADLCSLKNLTKRYILSSAGG
jgi:hypothetical protein